MVDRAWENGASRTHADYHPRSSNGSSQSPRNNWRNNNNNNNHRSGDNSSHYTQGNRRPYGQGNFENRNAQRFERPYDNQQGPRTRNFAANTHRSDAANDERPGYGSQRGYGNNPSFGQRGQQQSNRAPQSHGYGARGQQQGNRAPQSRGYGARSQQQGNFTPGTRGAARHERPERDPRTNPRRNFQPREAVKRPPNPRWLSRPEVRQARDEQRQKEYMQQFEGDYEQFDDDEAPQSHSVNERAPRGRRPRFEQAEEKHVTRLPDGRVLKGSRPEQRRNAQFWTEVDEDTGKLIEQVRTNEDELDQAPSSKPGRSTSANRTPRRGAARSKKGLKTSNPRSTGPKPSEKGFKWPSQQ
ncbi:hypothetical protein KDAU_09130 [Dictyobacter aurantiacus]|uniref:Uncharacterized protein n=2 Tax=Dictyobacter aurantiacus TaxID=1936993 RepID=A0A401Z9N6_9CHLR|nr:hypothetical protein KDAU_09130 [Dictyobacter aurantiacus]